MPVKDLDLSTLPKNPGVYQFKKYDDSIIYVGKAKNLKNRVTSYFTNTNSHSPKTRLMLTAAEKLDYMITDTELEALVLEATLIKKHMPRYNILLKDDKSYPYIRVSLEEDYPRIFVTRKLGAKGSRYFGPYTDVWEIRQTVRYLNQTFGIRTCKDTSFNRKRPCLDYDISRCTAPCTQKITKEEYQKNVDSVLMFLEGKNETLISELEQGMRDHSKKQEYEAAKIYRDRIEGIRRLADKQKIISEKDRNADIIALYRSQNHTMVEILFIRRGALLGKTSYAIKDTEIEKEKLLDDFLEEYYMRHEVPKELILSEHPKDKLLIRQLLERTSGSKTRMTVPERGEKKSLVSLAMKNAEIALEDHLNRKQKLSMALAVLKQELSLEKIPKRIEAFDNSNISGSNPVSSLVVFIDGEPKKSEYRKYKIQSVQGIDDFATMKEVIRRRYSKYPVPDLILIDGGKGQLASAIEALTEVYKTPNGIIGLAKKEEEIFLPDHEFPISLPRDSEALYLIQRVRDEAHRFAVTFHKHLRSKSITL